VLLDRLGFPDPLLTRFGAKTSMSRPLFAKKQTDLTFAIDYPPCCGAAVKAAAPFVTASIPRADKELLVGLSFQFPLSRMLSSSPRHHRRVRALL
jgi:hypothetical protein